MPTETSQVKKTIRAEDEADCPDPVGRSISMASKPNQSDQVQTPWRSINTVSAQWLSPAWITESSQSKSAKNSNLVVRFGFPLHSELNIELTIANLL